MNVVNKSFTDIKKKFMDYWGTLTPRIKTIAIAVSVAVLIAAVLLVYFLYRDEYVVLYSGLPAEESGEVIALLESAKIEHKVEGDTIYVLEEEEPEIRMQLATEGYPKESLTYDTFTSSLDWASTDFEQRAAMTFQMNERLQDTIETLDGVESAIVNISVPEDSSYALSEEESAASASVVLDLAPGVELTSEEVTGIQELVTKSVPGLTSENVVIVDQTGKQLNPAGTEEQSDAEAASSQLELEEYAANQIEQNILELFIPIFGEEGVKVACDIEIDFSQTITQEDTYTPVNGEEGIPDSSSTTYQGSADAANGGVPGTESNSGTDTYETPEEGDTSGETISTTEQIDYLVNHMSEYTESDQGVIEKVTISVLIDQESMTAEEQQTYTSLAANAAGVPEDAVVVEAIPFEAANEAEAEAQEQIQKSQVTETVRHIGFLIFLLIALIILVSTIKKIFRKRSDNDEDEDDEPTEDEPVDDVIDKIIKRRREQEQTERKLEEAQEGIKSMLGEDAVENEQRKQIVAIADENPEIVAEVIKSWLRGDEK